MEFNQLKMSVKDTLSLNKIYDSNRKSITALTDWLSKGREKDVFWCASAFVSRNMFLSDFARDVALCLLIKRKIEKGAVDRVIVEKKSVAEVIEAYLRRNNLSVAVEYKRDDSAFDIPGFLSEYKSYVLTKKEIAAAFKDNKMPNTSAPINIINTDFLASSVNGGKLSDGNFTNIQELTKKNNIWFCPLFLFNDHRPLNIVLSELQKDKSYRFIIRERYLTHKDYNFVYLLQLKLLSFLKKRIKYKDLDVSPIYNSVIKSDLISPNYWEGLLNYRFVKRLRQSNMKVDNFIDWYEGQPSSNGLFFGINKYYGKSGSIGYVGFFPIKNMMGTMPSKWQYENGVCPRKIGVVGRGYVPLFKEYCSYTNIQVVPGLRYGSLSKPIPPKSEGKTILLSLSYFVNNSKHILSVADTYFRAGKAQGVKFLIKNHPCNSSFGMASYGSYLQGADYEFVAGDFIDCVDRAHIVIVSQTTSTMEILSRGAMLIIIEDLGKVYTTYVPEDISKALYAYVFNYAGLEAALDGMLPLAGGDNKGLSASVLNNYFTPINEETAAAFFEGEQ